MEGDSPVRDIGYLRGLNEAVARGVEYGLEIIAVGERGATPVPMAVTSQARLAARHRIPLDLVIRRYLAAKTLLTDFVLEQAEGTATLDPALLRSALATQEAVFDRVLATATEEYRREEQARCTSQESRRVERIQRLLDGELVDPFPLHYGLSGFHLGLVALSADVRPQLRALSKKVDARLLAVTPSETETWAWLGGKAPIDPACVCEWGASAWPASVPLGIGEPSRDTTGWRRTHSQARAAASVTASTPAAVVRYADVALITAAGRDPLLLASLREMYLAPLAEEGDRGEVLRQTLRAYFEADRNSSSAAAALGVSRQTVTNRLRLVEERVGRQMEFCGESLSAALRLERAGLLASPD